MNQRASLPPEYFDSLYKADIDPWQFETSDYERAKYLDTLAALAGRHFNSAFEVGCSIGVLTQSLAAQCEDLFSVDVAEAALGRARERCRGLGHVRFARMCIPAEWPHENFDLIVFSEVLYYLSPADIEATVAATLASLAPDGVALLVHFTDPTNYPLSGDEAVSLFEQAAGSRLVCVKHERRPRYRLDRFDRP